jgi:hypothetical protein
MDEQPAGQIWKLVGKPSRSGLNPPITSYPDGQRNADYEFQLSGSYSRTQLDVAIELKEVRRRLELAGTDTTALNRQLARRDDRVGCTPHRGCGFRLRHLQIRVSRGSSESKAAVAFQAMSMTKLTTTRNATAPVTTRTAHGSIGHVTALPYPKEWTLSKNLNCRALPAILRVPYFRSKSHKPVSYGKQLTMQRLGIQLAQTPAGLRFSNRSGRQDSRSFPSFVQHLNQK